MIASAEELAITLSQEELSFLLVSMGAPIMPGFDMQTLDGASEEQLEVIFDSAQQSLLERGILIGNPNGTYTMPPPVMALVGLTAFPLWNIRLDVVSDAQNVSAHWFGGEHLVVEHTPVIPGNHKLCAIRSDGTLVDRILSFLPEILPIMREMTFKIAATPYQSAVTLVRNDGDQIGARKLLVERGLDNEMAKELISLINQTQSSINIRFTKTGKKPETAVSYMLYILVAAGKAIMVVPLENEGIVLVRACDLPSINHQITLFFGEVGKSNPSS